MWPQKYSERDHQYAIESPIWLPLSIQCPDNFEIQTNREDSIRAEFQQYTMYTHDWSFPIQVFHIYENV